MHVRRRYLNLGIFLLCLGAVPLAVDVGVLSPGVAADLTRLWPLILIGIGLGIMLRFSSVEWLGGIVVAGTFGLLVGTALAGGVPGVGCVGGPARGATVTRNGSFSGSDPFQVNVDLSCADLEVSQAATNDWTVRATTGQPPTINDDGGRLNLASAHSLPWGSGREDWSLTLPSQLEHDAYFTSTHRRPTSPWAPARSTCSVST